jgi:iron complex transport system substrate-binding protein
MPRIVSLTPALTAIITALGGKEALVGVTAYCHAPGVPVVGDFKPQPERILAQRPDRVVLAAYGSQRADRDALEALGLNVSALPLETLAEMRATTLSLGALLGREGQARALVGEFDRVANDVRARTAKRMAAATAPVRVLLVYDLEPGFVLTTGGGDHVSELLALAGADDVAAGAPRTARLGLELVLARRPDLIIHAARDARFSDDAAARAYWREAFPALPAVARGQVYVWPDDLLAQNGPHLAGVLARIAVMVDGARAP